MIPSSKITYLRVNDGNPIVYFAEKALLPNSVDSYAERQVILYESFKKYSNYFHLITVKNIIRKIKLNEIKNAQRR